jgi:hypothetical protein
MSTPMFEVLTAMLLLLMLMMQILWDVTLCRLVDSW